MVLHSGADGCPLRKYVPVCVRVAMCGVHLHARRGVMRDWRCAMRRGSRWLGNQLVRAGVTRPSPHEHCVSLKENVCVCRAGVGPLASKSTKAVGRSHKMEYHQEYEQSHKSCFNISSHDGFLRKMMPLINNSRAETELNLCPDVNSTSG